MYLKHLLQTPTVVTLGPFLHSQTLGGSQSSPRTGRRFPSPALSLPEADFPRTLRGHPRPLHRRGKHPEDLRFSGRDLRDVLLTTKHFLPRRSRFGPSKALVGKTLSEEFCSEDTAEKLLFTVNVSRGLCWGSAPPNQLFTDLEGTSCQLARAEPRPLPAALEPFFLCVLGGRLGTEDRSCHADAVNGDAVPIYECLGCVLA